MPLNKLPLYKNFFIIVWMKKKNASYIVTGIFMILSGLAGLVLTVLVFISGLTSAVSALSFTVISAALTMIWAIINLNIGFSSVGGAKNQKRLKRNFYLGTVSVIIFIVQILLSAANGISAVHLIILIACGFVIPCVYIFVCRLKI